jgi:site-specific DNA-methyltransferase (adenine-specific)
MNKNKIIQGNCLEVMKTLEDNSVDAVVTDPPYGLSFMGKKWDYDVPSEDIWREAMRVLKPGGYLLAFAGTRTQHRMAVRIEDAGFEIRDMIAWVYGSGFPKSLNIGKAVDKLQGNEREVVGEQKLMGTARRMKGGNYGDFGGEDTADVVNLTKGTSEWEGWGTSLKPALEPITVARKPLSEKTVAKNVLKWGTGGINIDGSRVGGITKQDKNNFHQNRKIIKEYKADDTLYELGMKNVSTAEHSQGRFPANLILDGSDEVVSLFPDSKSGNGKASTYEKEGGQWGNGKQIRNADFGDSGSASRFFYCAKSSKSERNKGCEELEEKFAPTMNNGIGIKEHDPQTATKKHNHHPTVKPIALMEYLVKLVSREGATVLDPFAGSGSTLIACKKLGRNYIGIEMEEDYIKIAEARLSAYKQNNP